MAYNELDIRSMLERYLEGESSLEEESRLKAYFSQETDIPADLAYAKAMFCTFSQLHEGVNRQAVPLRMETARRQRGFIGKVAAIAASLVIGIAVGGNVALMHYKHESMMATGQPVAPAPQEQKIYGYINGRPITDVHEACSRGAETLRSMDNHFKEPARQYLSNFKAQNASMRTK